VRKARGAEIPSKFWHEPLVYQWGLDDFLGPCEDIVVGAEAFGIDLEDERRRANGDN
jgi:fumarylacetoacetate (FAA) hydrolase